MYPIHDADIVLLLALSLASKRRPAELAEIVAAAELLPRALPAEGKLADAFGRLSRNGLLVAEDGGYRLTQAAEAVLAGQPRQTDAAKRIPRIKEKLAAHTVAEELPPVVVTEEALADAVLAHKAAARTPGPNLLVPKPKAEDKYAPRRKPGPAHWRKRG